MILERNIIELNKTMSIIKTARNIESAVITKFLELIKSQKESISSVEDMYKKMDSLKKTQMITDDEIVELSKKKKTVTGRPKNSWMLFLQKYRDEHPGNGKSGKEISQEASAEWAKMNEEEKLPYTNEAIQLMKDWKVKNKPEDITSKDVPPEHNSSIESDNSTSGKNVKSTQKKSKDKKSSTDNLENTVDFSKGTKYYKTDTKYQWCYCINEDNNTVNILCGKEGCKQQHKEKVFTTIDDLNKYILKETTSKEKSGYVKCS